MQGCSSEAYPRFRFHASRFLGASLGRRGWVRIIHRGRTVDVGQPPNSLTGLVKKPAFRRRDLPQSTQ